MSNIIEYLHWRGDLKLSERQLNIIDVVMLSQLSIIDLEAVMPIFPSPEEIKLKYIAENYESYDFLKSDEEKRLGLLIPPKSKELLKKMSQAKRFKNMKISNYLNAINEEEGKQFAALTVKLEKNLRLVIFSGTDDTIVGWKENFDLLYKSPIPAQTDALDYLTNILEMYKSDIIVCGHSKGGNLSLYSGTHIDKKYSPRIKGIYNFDGPGFNPSLLKKGEYEENLEKVITLLPSSSVIGAIFEHREKVKVVRSDKEGLYQHDVFSWQIDVDDFIYEKHLTRQSREVDKAITKITNDMTMREKIGFSKAFYLLMTRTESKNLLELSTKKRRLFSEYFKLEKKYKQYMKIPLRKAFKSRAIRKLVFVSYKEYREAVKKGEE